MKSLGKSFLAAILVLLVVLAVVALLGLVISFIVWTGPAGILIVGFLVVWWMVHSNMAYNGDF